MAEDTQHNVRIKYSEQGISAVYKKIRMVDQATKRLVTTTYKMNAAGTAMQKYSRTIAPLPGQVKKGSNALRGMATRFVGLQVAMSYAMQAGRAVMQWVQQGIKDFRKFENNLAEVQTIIGEVAGGELPKLKAGIENLSVGYGKDVNDLTRGMYDILSASFAASEGLDLLKIATEASVAGLTDVSTSVDVFTSILNAWGLTVTQANMISDQLFQTVVQGKLRFEDLANAMGYIAPIAANLGVEFKEVAAALSTVTRQGQHVDMAARGLALGLQNIADLSPKAAKAAAKYGVDLSAVALQVGGLESVIGELHEATEKYGAKVLPEMISNMRSLRIFMALAGDEGIDGFRRDLDNLTNSTGRTEQALATMASSTQFQVNMLDQSMKMLERDIGEAWSGLDIWFKKSKLWWGTLLSGGDADAAVKQYEDRVDDIKIASAKAIGAMGKMMAAPDLTKLIRDVDFTQFKTFEQGVDAIANIMSGAFSNGLSEGVTNLTELNDAITADAIAIGELTEEQIALDGYLSKFKQLKRGYEDGSKSFMEVKSEITEINDALADMGHNFTVVGDGISDFGKKNKKGSVVINAFINGVIKIKDAISDLVTDDTTDEVNKLFKSLDWGFTNDLQVRIDTIGTEINELTDDISAAQIESNAWKQSEESIKLTIDNLQSSIEEYESNIFELDKAIVDLRFDVEDLYKTLSGSEFAGVDTWKLAVSAAGTQMDRFNHVTQRTIKYNDELNTSYMDGVDELVSQSDVYEDVINYMDWYNDEIWKQVAGNDANEESMRQMIISIGSYTQEQKEAKAATKAQRKEIDALNLAMKRNNLEMMKIELAGMMRRRGLTRSEEKVIKKIKIDNAEIRIKIMEREVSEETVLLKEHNSDVDTELESLQALYKKYVDTVQHDIWQLKDTRNSDLKNMIYTINHKKKKLEKYVKMQSEQFTELNNTEMAYMGTLKAIAEDENLSVWFNDLLGIGAIQLAKAEMISYMELLGTHGKGVDIKTPTPSTPASSSHLMRDNIFMMPGIESGRKRAEDLAHLRSLDLSGDSGFARGTNYVPETKPYILHKGESVIPSGSGKSTGNITISITNHNTIDSKIDIKDLAKMQAQVIKTELAHRHTGKSKYRLR